MKRSILPALYYLGILYAIYLLILLSIPYLSLKANVDFLLTKQFIYHIKTWRWSFYLHVFSSSFIILAGLFQFNRYIIHKQKKIHKICGYIYISLLLLLSGPASLIMGLYANGGVFVQISFILLALLWIGCTFFALYFVLTKNYEAHGRFLLRSYALTLSAITLRLYLFLFDYFRLPLGPIESYTLVAYLSWIPNLIVAEIVIKKGFIKNLLT